MVNQEDDIKHSYALTPPSLLIDIKFKDLFLFRFYFIIIFWADPVNFVHNPFFFYKSINSCKGQYRVRAAVQQLGRELYIHVQCATNRYFKVNISFFWYKKGQVDINLMTVFHYRPPQGRASLIVPLAPIFGRELFS